MGMRIRGMERSGCTHRFIGVSPVEVMNSYGGVRGSRRGGAGGVVG
jgi:hypothetical protein